MAKEQLITPIFTISKLFLSTSTFVGDIKFGTRFIFPSRMVSLLNEIVEFMPRGFQIQRCLFNVWVQNLPFQALLQY